MAFLSFIYLADGTPHATNYRHPCKKVMEAYADAKPWFGIEQEYMFMDLETNKPYGWPRLGFPEPQVTHRRRIIKSTTFGTYL